MINTYKFNSLDLATKREVIDVWYTDAYGDNLPSKDEYRIKQYMANVAGITYSDAYKQHRLTGDNTTNTQYGLANIDNVINQMKLNNYQNSVYNNSPSNFESVNHYNQDGYQGFSILGD